nr:MAG TPA: protein of unknown function (DUF4419) [Caudoviricetes sp.]
MAWTWRPGKTGEWHRSLRVRPDEIWLCRCLYARLGSGDVTPVAGRFDSVHLQSGKSYMRIWAVLVE